MWGIQESRGSPDISRGSSLPSVAQRHSEKPGLSRLKPALGKSPPSPLTTSSTFQTEIEEETIHLVKCLARRNLCCKYLFVFAKGSSATEPSWGGWYLTEANIASPTSPRAATCSSRSASSRGWRRVNPPYTSTLRSWHSPWCVRLSRCFLFQKPEGFAASPKGWSNQPLYLKCYNFWDKMWQESLFLQRLLWLSGSCTGCNIFLFKF